MSIPLASIINILIALLFILGGIISFLLPWVDSVRFGLVQFLLEEHTLLILLGIIFFLCGCAIVFYTLQAHRRKYYIIETNLADVHVDSQVVENYVNTYWETLFPGRDIPFQLTVTPHKIKLLADLPYVPVEQQKGLTEKINHELGELFTQYLGYHELFSLHLSYAPPAVVPPEAASLDSFQKSL